MFGPGMISHEWPDVNVNSRPYDVTAERALPLALVRAETAECCLGRTPRLSRLFRGGSKENEKMCSSERWQNRSLVPFRVCQIQHVRPPACSVLPRCKKKERKKRKTINDDIHQCVQRLSSQRLCYLYDFHRPLSLKPCWNRKWRRLPTLLLLITDELGPGYEMHYEAELRGITGVWTVNLYICRGPPPEKARLLHLSAHLRCLPARQPGTRKS